MPIRATCEACESSFLVKDELAGKLGKCPRCGEVFRVPGGTDEERAPAAAGDLLDFSPSDSSVIKGGGSGSGHSGNLGSRLVPSANGRPGDAAPAKKAGLRAVPIWAWASAGGTAIAIAVAAWLLWPSPKKPVAQGPAGTPPQQPTTPTGVAKPSKPSRFDDSHLPELPKPKPGATDAEILKYAQHAIVRIDVYSDTWNAHQSVGSGFVIEKKQGPDGAVTVLVATNYHVIAPALKADVVFDDKGQDLRYGIEGYMSVRPEYDLAILKLNGAPKQTVALPLRWQDNPDVQSEVFAFGNPQGYTFVVERGHVNSVLTTSRLPPDDQEWLKGSLKPLNGSGDPSERIDQQWIMHSAKIEPGNSGGPLLNTQGEVLGVNSWIARGRGEEGTRKFAIHARYLNEMMAQLSAQPEPLTRYRRAREENVAAGQPALKLEDLRDAFTKAAATGWKPKSRDEYKLVRDVARMWSWTQYILTMQPRAFPHTHAGTPAEWKAELSRILGQWQKVPWDESHIKAVNKVATVSTPRFLDGIFLFGKVTDEYEDEEKHKMLKVVAIGADRTIYVPVLPQTAALPKGSACLVVGLVLGFESTGDNPLKPKEVPVVVTHAMIKLTARDSGKTPEAKPPEPKSAPPEPGKTPESPPGKNPTDKKSPGKGPTTKTIPAKKPTTKSAA